MGESIPLSGTSRMLAVVLVSIVGLLSAAQSAHAVFLADDAGNPVQPYQAWADRSRVPTVPVTVRLHLGHGCPVPAWEACAWSSPLLIVMERQDRQLLYHELGHEFDYTVMGGGVVIRERVHNPESLSVATPPRVAFARILDRSPSWVNNARGSLPETFAQAYSYCALMPRSWSWRGQIGLGNGYRPTVRQHRRVCNLIRNVAPLWTGGNQPPEG